MESVAVRLAQIRPAREYAETRNHLKGTVTGLSPYLRHGVLGLAEVRDVALSKVDQGDQASKLPEDIRHGTTGLACIDAFSQDLAQTGYLQWLSRLWGGRGFSIVGEMGVLWYGAG